MSRNYTTSNSRGNHRGFGPPWSPRRQQNNRTRHNFPHRNLQFNLNNHHNFDAPAHLMNSYPGNGPSNYNHKQCKGSNSSYHPSLHNHDTPGSPSSFMKSPEKHSLFKQNETFGRIASPNMVSIPDASKLSYLDALSVQIWQLFIEKRQTPATYARKAHFKNALHMIISSVFENSRIYLVGSSLNGFGSDYSDADMCLVVTSQELQGKRDASAILQHIMTPLRKCSFIKQCNLIQAKVPILKFCDQLSGVECDLNVNNVIGVYNTHLLAMYARVDWRLRPLGLFVKHWAQKMDIHDGSRGRLSSYPLILMLIQFLQCGCSPPVLPNLHERFPKIFNYDRPLKEVDMRLQLPWAELASANTSSLSELFVGFISYYNNFDFGNWAISVRYGHPIPIDVAIRNLPPHDRANTSASYKIFVEEPFCQSNAARSLYDETVLAQIQRVFARTDRVLHGQKAPLHSLWT
ncbi:unnamed protein product [Hymenolepis diminuta]|uniref:Uncharacterized protein n=1 Tax=Hymenolepis diminuta TaxID=6216 RepID=A0A564XZI0_HYMDI|nr:unnamed protein product [Hymenolepis diminuta]